MKSYILSLVENKKFFGFKSSEDIFWVIFGYCLASKKAKNYKDIQYIENFRGFIQLEYCQSFSHYNWGLIFRLQSDDDLNSIKEFEKAFKSFDSHGRCREAGRSFSEKINSFQEKEIDFLEILEQSCRAINSLLELQMLLYGYIDSCRINNIHDPYLSRYILMKNQYESVILQNLELPEYGNCLRLLNAWFYSPQEGLKHYSERMTTLILSDINAM